MAQTKRKRRTKHRGNAAGIVEHRGRTSRPPSPEERKKQQKQAARGNRFSKPPTWTSAATRAFVVTVFFVVFITLVMHRPLSASIALGAFVLLLYIPMGYFMDQQFYRRYQQRQERDRAARR
jgi:Flp pilus assembly protein TadB